MAMVLGSMKTNRKIKRFGIHKIPLNNNRLYEYVLSFLKANKIIEALTLSWNNFLPKQLTELMLTISRKKTLYELDLSYNNMVETSRTQPLVKIFIDKMRKFILRSNIFHLDLTGMQLGKLVNKLVESIRASSTLCCVHLSENNIPFEIMKYMDKTL
jgi:hypothetical protein